MYAPIEDATELWEVYSNGQEVLVTIQQSIFIE